MVHELQYFAYRHIFALCTLLEDGKYCLNFEKGNRITTKAPIWNK